MKVHVVKQTMSPARLTKPLMCMLLVVYFGYHALHGERGLYALFREKRILASLETDYLKTKAEREKMEQHVLHLRDASLDRDLLDEQMRRMLGVMKKGELVVLNDDLAK